MSDRSITPDTVRAELDALTYRVLMLETLVKLRYQKSFEQVCAELAAGERLRILAAYREEIIRGVVRADSFADLVHPKPFELKFDVVDEATPAVGNYQSAMKSAWEPGGNEVFQPNDLKTVIPITAPDLGWCFACGYQFDHALGRYGCPNCHGEGLSKNEAPGV